ncbi:methyltransferase [Nocardioides antri]|uniref:Hydroxyneurosporene methyltransferase n=1 Tax=Nocardioides antri TaxID=2607659 RepID=A0A5B1M0I7_9ACTN|nr:methyltransferase [Nocardioides antri]KAA1426443.1 hydroxyneurosporene methyltransferase [Nocardioides antri]
MAPQPHETIWNLTNAVVASSALHTVAELGVADQIGDEPVSSKDLAAACEVEAEALDRVLCLLAANGVFERRGDGYQHTDASRLLRTDHAMSMREFARMMGLPVMRSSFDRLDHSVRTGRPSIELVAGAGLWPYLESHPEDAEIFGRAMTSKAAGDTAAVLRAYDFSRFDTIADIGGGRGHLLRAVLDAVPAAEGILVDLPDVIASLDVGRDRMTTRAADFFVDPLPTADAYLLMEVLHDWPDAETAAILGAVRRAASPGARVLIIENVLVDAGADRRGHTLDVIMLAITGGRERTGDELAELLQGAGFSSSTVIETGGPLRIVEAVV